MVSAGRAEGGGRLGASSAKAPTVEQQEVLRLQLKLMTHVRREEYGLATETVEEILLIDPSNFLCMVPASPILAIIPRTWCCTLLGSPSFSQLPALSAITLKCRSSHIIQLCAPKGSHPVSTTPKTSDCARQLDASTTQVRTSQD
jgi:hypothetical protein